MPDILERAADDPTLVDDILATYKIARDRSVFGVPTIVIEGSKPAFGPILAVAPLGDDAATWWSTSAG